MEYNMFIKAILTAACICTALPAFATDFSFTGNFTRDDSVQFFNFNVAATSAVTLKSFQYGGGTQADGNVVSFGGFDSVLTVFDAAGFQIGSNDDDRSGQVNADPNTGSFFDTFLELTLGAGSYTVAISQFDNLALGGLAAGFTFTNSPNFTTGITSTSNCTNGQFCDVDGSNRTSNWAFDILNVDTGRIGDPPSVPLPATMPLLAAALGLFGFVGRRRLRKP
jgi:hypothetical protein